MHISLKKHNNGGPAEAGPPLFNLLQIQQFNLLQILQFNLLQIRQFFYCKFCNLIYRNMQFGSVALFNDEHYEYRGGQRYYHAEAYIYAHKAGGSAVYARRDIVYHAGYIAE